MSKNIIECASETVSTFSEVGELDVCKLNVSSNGICLFVCECWNESVILCIGVVNVVCCIESYPSMRAKIDVRQATPIRGRRINVDPPPPPPSLPPPLNYQPRFFISKSNPAFVNTVNSNSQILDIQPTTRQIKLTLTTD